MAGQTTHILGKRAWALARRQHGVVTRAQLLDWAIAGTQFTIASQAGACIPWLIDRATFAFTDSPLERRFLPIVRRAGLPTPDTQRHVSGFRVDFFWRKCGLVVETDGGSYHRTPFQSADRGPRP